MFDYHLYSIPFKTTIKNNQTKQLVLLKVSNVNYTKEYLFKGASYYYTGRYGEDKKNLRANVYVIIDNSKKNNLGIPLPKGIVRFYKKDSSDNSQFIGEDTIPHTPENEPIRLKLGNAFDVTAKRIQTEFRKISSSKFHRIYECSFKIYVKNAKNENIKVKIEEPIPGEWEITKESHPHKKTSSHTATWELPVQAKNKAVLTYKVRIKF